MSIIRRNGDLFPALPHLWGDDFYTRDLLNWGLSHFSSTGTSIPAVNIREKKDSFEVEMAAPGMQKNDFNIELDGNVLSISAEKHDKKEEKASDERYAFREFSYQSFQRSFNLPKDVADIDKIKAHYENGLLQLSIPKKEVSRQKLSRTISIS